MADSTLKQENIFNLINTVNTSHSQSTNLKKTYTNKDTIIAKKDYTYRGTWKHRQSRARNLARRDGLTKVETIAKYGRLPKGKDWWGKESSCKEWENAWEKANPKHSFSSSIKEVRV